jgi:hypothetical protein
LLLQSQWLQSSQRSRLLRWLRPPRSSLLKLLLLNQRLLLLNQRLLLLNQRLLLLNQRLLPLKP